MAADYMRIEGHDINGSSLKGNYIGSNQPMAEGFKANAVFFKLGFLDKTTVSLGRQFRELLPVIWMKAGAIGPCPSLNTDQLPTMMILSENKFAVLLDENNSHFKRRLFMNLGQGLRQRLGCIKTHIFPK